MEPKLRIVPSEATEQMAGYGCRELIDGEMIWVKLGNANLNANLFRAAWPGMLSATPKITREQVDVACRAMWPEKWHWGLESPDELARKRLAQDMHWDARDIETFRSIDRAVMTRFLSAAFGAEVEG